MDWDTLYTPTRGCTFARERKLYLSLLLRWFVAVTCTPARGARSRAIEMFWVMAAVDFLDNLFLSLRLPYTPTFSPLDHNDLSRRLKSGESPLRERKGPFRVDRFIVDRSAPCHFPPGEMVTVLTSWKWAFGKLERNSAKSWETGCRLLVGIQRWFEMVIFKAANFRLEGNGVENRAWKSEANWIVLDSKGIKVLECCW